jgi:hypothetical protein
MPAVDVAEALLPIKEKLESIVSRINKLKKKESVRYSQLSALQVGVKCIIEPWLCSLRAVRRATRICDTSTPCASFASQSIYSGY